ncbi:hypothetical protein [Streptomyces zaomyceticus]|uniref:hypothetical protein n=1 Tax=Streptomyces zaomyceticus TaxID=68286 RepID=UPI003677CADA
MHAQHPRPQATTAVLVRAVACRAPGLTTTYESVCAREKCSVAWSGDEADCWNCGLPATHRSTQRGSALQRLLATFHARTPRRGSRKAALA